MPRDYETAVEWFRRAAGRGNADAQYNLGVLYIQGKGVPQWFAEAARWFRMAAEQGEGSAQYSLGIMHKEGDGVPRDSVQAYMWLSLAAEQGVGKAVQARNALAGTMTKEQLARARALVKAFHEKK